jgi:hypothetical protein
MFKIIREPLPNYHLLLVEAFRNGLRILFKEIVSGSPIKLSLDQKETKM